MNLQNNKALHSLLSELGWIDQKESLVYSFTNERTVRSSEMTNPEAVELIKHLQKELWKKEKKEQPDPADGMRKYIISIFYRKYNAQTKEQKQEAVRECKAWIEKNFKGDLNGFSRQDLYKIKLAAEKMYADGAKAIRKAL